MVTGSPPVLLQRAAGLACTSHEVGDWVTNQWWFWLLLFLASVGGGCIVGFIRIRIRESR